MQAESQRTMTCMASAEGKGTRSWTAEEQGRQDLGTAEVDVGYKQVKDEKVSDPALGRWWCDGWNRSSHW